jgi:hypothetical protein
MKKNGNSVQLEKREISKRRSKLIYVISQMPPLSHWPDREKAFDINKSDVCRWLVQRVELLDWLLQKANALGAIEYDAETKLWRGVNYGVKEIE